MTNEIEQSLADKVRAAFGHPSLSEQRRGARLVREAGGVDLEAMEAAARGRLALTEADVVKVEIFRALRADALAWIAAGRPAGELFEFSRRALREDRRAKSALLELRACGLPSEVVDDTRWFKVADFARAALESNRIGAWLQGSVAKPPEVTRSSHSPMVQERKLDRVEAEIIAGAKLAGYWLEVARAYSELANMTPPTEPPCHKTRLKWLGARVTRPGQGRGARASKADVAWAAKRHLEAMWARLPKDLRPD